jgi:hypothetical protein
MPINVSLPFQRNQVLLREHLDRVFAVVLLCEETWNLFLAPDLFPGALRVQAKVRITLFDIPIDASVAATDHG